MTELQKIIKEMEADRSSANEKMNNKDNGQNLVSYFGGRNDVLDKYIYKLEQILHNPSTPTNDTENSHATNA